MSEGKRRVRSALASAQPLGVVSDNPNESKFGLPPRCPVTPLGVSPEACFYLDANKHMIALTAKDHARLPIMKMFGEDMNFVYSIERWQRRNADGHVTGWKPEMVAEDLMRACAIAGEWNPVDRERGRGAWRGDDGELILHVGDQVLVFPRHPNPWGLRSVFRPGVLGRYVYPRGERSGVPADIDSPSEHPGEDLLSLLETWNWRRADLDAVLLLGWIGAAMIGGALKWRPSVWLTGGKGTGKSSLQKLIREILGAALVDLADTTPAYIWQVLRNQTLPVSVDELEADVDNRKALAVVKLARVSASGGKLGRGSDKHVPLDFTLRSAFQFSSVLMPPLMGPDRSRLAILDLKPLAEGAAEPDLSASRLRPIGAALRRRLVNGWDRFDATLESYRRALAEVGHVARGADQFGTLLACADMLLFQRPDPDAAAEWVKRLRATDLSEISDDLSDEMECLQHLLAVPIDPYRKGDRISLGEWINRAAGRVQEFDDPREARRVLCGHGIRLEREGSVDYVAIANRHSGLAGLFAGSRWQTPVGNSGVWVQTLRRLPDAVRCDKALYYGGPASKSTLVPLRLVPAPDGGRQVTFPDL